MCALTLLAPEESSRKRTLAAFFSHARYIIPVQGLNSSLRLVLARVLASTRLTMTAQ